MNPTTWLLHFLAFASESQCRFCSERDSTVKTQNPSVNGDLHKSPRLQEQWSLNHLDTLAHHCVPIPHVSPLVWLALLFGQKVSFLSLNNQRLSNLWQEFYRSDSSISWKIKLNYLWCLFNLRLLTIQNSPIKYIELKVCPSCAILCDSKLY